MTHFTDIELRRWRDGGPGADRERVIAHVAECPACASRYADAIRSAPLTADDASDVADFAAAGRAVVADVPRRQTWKRRAMVAVLAAAAVVALAIVVPRLGERPIAVTPTLRGTAVNAIAPSGSVPDRDLQFVWSSGVAADRYRIDIADANAAIYSGEASGSPWMMPADVRGRLQPGVGYWWTVTALDARGAAVTTSPRRAFAVTAPQ